MTQDTCTKCGKVVEIDCTACTKEWFPRLKSRGPIEAELFPIDITLSEAKWLI